MPITVIILLIITCVFAARGALLGFVAWASRIGGLLAGYVLALSYRGDFAHMVSIYARDWSPIILQVICGFILFISGTILVNMFISSLIDILRKSNKKLHKALKYKTRNGRIAGAICNGLLGIFSVFLAIWAYNQAHTFQLVPALADNNKTMQGIANTIGSATFGFLLDNAIKKPTLETSTPIIAAPSAKKIEIQAPISLDALRKRANKIQQEDIKTPKQAHISLHIEDIYAQGSPAIVPKEIGAVTDAQDNTLSAQPQSAMADKIQEVMQNPKLISSALEQYMPAEEAAAASKKLQVMMKDPETKKAMQKNIEKLLNNPALMQQMLQKRYNENQSSN